MGAGVILNASISGWINTPTEVKIDTFSLPATSLPYPAITFCKRNKFDAGDYLRAVFDNFQFYCGLVDGDCKETELLRSHYERLTSRTKVEDSSH